MVTAEGRELGKHPSGRKSSWALLRSAGVLEAILDSASQCILAVGVDGRIRAANQRTLQILGYKPHELQDKIVEVLVPEEQRKGHKEKRRGYFAAPRVRPIGEGLELKARRKDGTTIPVEISLSYVGTGKDMLAIAFISDISQRKTLEEQLFQAQKLEAVGRLAGGVAHDFNNLLTVIMGNDRFLLSQLSTIDPARAYAEEIMKASERAAALTRQLLAFSRRQVIQPQVLDLNHAIRQSEKMMRRLLGEGIVVDYRLASEAGLVRLDSSQLDQILLNLLINARDAMPGGGMALVETACVTLGEDYARTHAGVKPGPYVMLAVTDTGKGIAPETQKHIFEPFFTTKPAEKGTGLGLATVYGIVKQNGGDIWVYSEAGVGSTFKVYLPKVDRAVQVDEQREYASSQKGGTETVLVVEDESGVRDVVCRVLRMAGYRVLEARTAQEALNLDRAHRDGIHLLVTDVVMPHMGGPELAAGLKRRRPQLKVLYLSGYTENAIVQQGILDPDLNFLQKPFEFEKLLAKVRESLDR